MKRTNIRRTLIAAVLVGATSMSVGAFAQGFSGHGMWGYGPGYGMMGGYGHGYGMMGGYGPGYGMGPGMMWGYGAGAASTLNLNDEQRDKIGKIQNDTGRKQQGLIAKMREEQRRMSQLSNADTLDEAALSKSFKALSELRQQMFDNSLAAQKQIDGLLTKEQREQLRAGGHCGWNNDNA